ncbi:MAG: hypothetical protein LBT50_08855 [Prevotellaceae bacterium]|jgi:hypothetical protein|nr:hypothetical protein [Prevotellaceae bacterium]
MITKFSALRMNEPLSKKDWEKNYGKNLKELRDEEEEKRTKRIKLWKLEIKYIKKDQLK